MGRTWGTHFDAARRGLVPRFRALLHTRRGAKLPFTRRVPAAYDSGSSPGCEGAPVRTRLLPLLPLLLIGVGCESDAAPPAPAAPPPAIGTAFDPGACGTVAGRVTWTGPVPVVADFPDHRPQPDGTCLYLSAKNPYAPRVAAKSKALAGAVVWLQGTDPAKARPWDHPPVAVEVESQAIAVAQGERRGRVGFVRRGDAVTVSSVDARYHVLRGRGDAFFSLTLPEPEKPVTRTLGAAGRVELSSGSGRYWMRGDLFVVEHPYYAVTDAEGRFRFDRVPAGPVTVTVWHPNWEVERFERDPDSTMVARTVYKRPLERTAAAEVTRGGAAEVAVTLP